MVGGASLTIFAVEAGQSIGGPFRRLALLAPRGRVFGTGPNDFPVTHTAATAQITPAMTGPKWRLTAVGEQTVSLTRDELLAMDQATHDHDHMYGGVVDHSALDPGAPRRSGSVRERAEGRDARRVVDRVSHGASFVESQYMDDRRCSPCASTAPTCRRQVTRLA